MTSLSKVDTNRIGRAVLAFILAGSVLLLPACANSSGNNGKSGGGTAAESTEQSADTQVTPKLESKVSKIEHGNVTLTITASKALETFARGDILSVAFDGKTVDAPLVTAYTELDSGAVGFVARKERDKCLLITNMGDFAGAHGVTESTSFVVSLKQKGGYQEDLRMRDLSYTDERSDYSNLSDAEFANFRVVGTTGMGKDVLYRGATPIDPKHNRNTYADAALKDAGVKTILNLANTEEEATAFPGYADTYYASVSHLALGMHYDFTSSDFQEKLARGLRYLASNDSPYYIHCLEGKDRTGFVVATLECLMGASYDEVIADYMTTFTNYYGVTPDDPRYEYNAQRGIVLTLKHAFGVDDLKGADLAGKAEEYLKHSGLTQDEVAALKSKLSSAVPAAK